jgi:hypothetical protein
MQVEPVRVVESNGNEISAIWVHVLVSAICWALTCPFFSSGSRMTRDTCTRVHPAYVGLAIIVYMHRI